MITIYMNVVERNERMYQEEWKPLNSFAVSVCLFM